MRLPVGLKPPALINNVFTPAARLKIVRLPRVLLSTSLVATYEAAAELVRNAFVVDPGTPLFQRAGSDQLPLVFVHDESTANAGGRSMVANKKQQKVVMPTRKTFC